MKARLAIALVVTFVSACGGRTRPPVAAASDPTREVDSNTNDDYVVGPFVTSTRAGEVRTYYIVRN